MLLPMASTLSFLTHARGIWTHSLLMPPWPHNYVPRFCRIIWLSALRFYNLRTTGQLSQHIWACPILASMFSILQAMFTLKDRYIVVLLIWLCHVLRLSTNGQLTYSLCIWPMFTNLVFIFPGNLRNLLCIIQHLLCVRSQFPSKRSQCSNIMIRPT